MEKLIAGDPIKIFRSSKGGYYHFGIYAGKDKVIHYVEQDFQNFSKGIIKKTSMKKFVDSSDISDIELIEFPGSRFGHTTSVSAEAFASVVGNSAIIGPLFSLIESQFNQYVIYSNKETLERAESKIGEDNYNLVFNNCEHFVWWCKTGIKRSEQIEEKMHTLKKRPLDDFEIPGTISTWGEIKESVKDSASDKVEELIDKIKFHLPW